MQQELFGDAAARRRREVAYHRFGQVLREVAVRFQHSALSLAITQSRDFACALCDADGESVVEWEGSAILAGTLGAQLRAAREACAQLTGGRDGDVVALCEPFLAGVDPSYLTLCIAVPDEEQGLIGFLVLCAARGEARPKAGPAPIELDVSMLPTVREAEEAALGAMPPAVGPRYQAFQGSALTPGDAFAPRTIDEEGERLAPVVLNEDRERQLAALARDPIERLCDLRAQQAALRHGQQRLRALVKRVGVEVARADLLAIKDAAAGAMVELLRRIPAGFYAFADSVDDDGSGARDLPVRVTLRREGDRMEVDLSESAPASEGALNLVSTVSRAVVRAALISLLPPGAPRGDASLRPLAILTAPGSILDARPPHALCWGHETALRLYDAVLGALAQALPAAVPAASGGSLSALALLGPRVYHREPLPGGRGAGLGAPGRAARSRPLSLSLIGGLPASVELLEQRLPLRVLRWAVREDSGGGGESAGGDGAVRELVLLGELHAELCGDRRRRPPFGQKGGGPGQLGRDTLLRDGVERALPAKVRLLLRRDDVLRIESPGGGGHGDPQRAAFFAQLLST